MKEIIHIVTDEKFINNTYYQFEKLYPGQNRFFLLVKDVDAPLKYVTFKAGMKLESENTNNLPQIAAQIPGNAIVCSHGLNYQQSLLMNLLPETICFIWFLWGTEFYDNRKVVPLRKLVGTKTYARFIGYSYLQEIKIRLKNVLRSSVYRLRTNRPSPDDARLKAMRNAHFCGILYKEEFDHVKSRLQSSIKMLRYSYYPIEQMISDKNQWVKGDNILLGNSASYFNNHLEAFEVLHRMPLQNRKVVTPLSYGDKKYAAVVQQEGERILGKNFCPLMNYMPLYDYNDFLRQCGIVVMNHFRQQAVGNVMTMLWMGAKVYLDERNTLYTYLTRIGVKIYSIQRDLVPDNSEALSMLSEAEQYHNRQVLKEEVGEASLFRDLKNKMDSVLHER